MQNLITSRLNSLTYKGIPVWRHAQVIQWTAQIVSGVVVVALVAWFFTNIANAISDRDIPFGFDFLGREYQTPIGQHFLPYESSDSFLYALVVGATNTIFVSVIGVILATALGIFIGISRLSGNWLVSKIALVYIEFFRNVPLLVQLFFWFYIVLALPTVREGYNLADIVYLNNAGLYIPMVTGNGVAQGFVWAASVVVAIAAGVLVQKRMARREEQTGSTSYPVMSGIGAAVIVGLVGWFVITAINGGFPLTLTTPEPQGAFGRFQRGEGFELSGGMMALLIGLVMYTSSFIAEIVRAGIQSVGKGQTEASRSLGLSALGTIRSVTFPQALRVIVPPTISQYLNLTKNSSLAAAIGYTDLTNVAKTMTQTAPALSIFVLIMAAYLAMSLTYSLIGNIYNRRISF